jgi:demethylmenaquinone methyltransferase / 2-methoxy-6-polyprenyl-1,4-benzoquinol methylase
MFDAIADRYDRLNRLLSLGLDGRWRRRAVRLVDPQPGQRVLDLATGTAELALAMARVAGVSVVGLDPSEQMLAIGRRKVARRGLSGRVELGLGDAEHIPLETDSVDHAVIAFGIRNVPDRARGLSEMARVVRPGGRVVVLELTEPRGRLLGALPRWYLRHLVPWVGAALSGAREYRYLQESVAAFPAPQAFADLMARAGLVEVRWRALTAGVAGLFVGKVPSGC